MIIKTERIQLGNFKKVNGGTLGEFVMTKFARVHSVKVSLETQSIFEFKITTIEDNKLLAVDSVCILAAKKGLLANFSIGENVEIIWSGKDVAGDFDIFIYKRRP